MKWLYIEIYIFSFIFLRYRISIFAFYSSRFDLIYVR